MAASARASVPGLSRVLQRLRGRLSSRRPSVPSGDDGDTGDGALPRLLQQLRSVPASLWGWLSWWSISAGQAARPTSSLSHVDLADVDAGPRLTRVVAGGRTFAVGLRWSDGAQIRRVLPSLCPG